jgi:hypothetical protein
MLYFITYEKLTFFNNVCYPLFLSVFQLNDLKYFKFSFSTGRWGIHCLQVFIYTSFSLSLQWKCIVCSEIYKHNGKRILTAIVISQHIQFFCHFFDRNFILILLLTIITLSLFSVNLTFKRQIKSRLPFADVIRSSPYSPRFQDKG